MADLVDEEMAAVYAAAAAARLDVAMPHEDEEELLFDVAPRGGVGQRSTQGWPSMNIVASLLAKPPLHGCPSFGHRARGLAQRASRWAQTSP